jgi:hypothetical protein
MNSLSFLTLENAGADCRRCLRVIRSGETCVEIAVAGSPATYTCMTCYDGIGAEAQARRGHPYLRPGEGAPPA